MTLAFYDHELIGGPMDGRFVRTNNIAWEIRVALPPLLQSVRDMSEHPDPSWRPREGRYVRHSDDTIPCLHWGGEV